MDARIEECGATWMFCKRCKWLDHSPSRWVLSASVWRKCFPCESKRLKSCGIGHELDTVSTDTDLTHRFRCESECWRQFLDEAADAVGRFEGLGCILFEGEG